MEKLNISYDSESDDLFAYLEGKKSKGAVELGNFIIDFDEEGNLAAMQILNVTEILSKFFSKIKDASQIKEVYAEIINFRNIEGINFKISEGTFEEEAKILIPHIKEKSPVLRY